jgi:hypothetical protein
MLLAENSLLLSLRFNADRTTTNRLATAAAADCGPQHFTGCGLRNHAFRLDPQYKENPIIRINTSAAQRDPGAVGFVWRIFQPPRRAVGFVWRIFNNGCRGSLGSFGAFSQFASSVVGFVRRILMLHVVGRWVRSAHSHNSHRRSLGSFGALLLWPSYQPSSCDWVRLAHLDALATKIDLGRSKARKMRRLRWIKWDREKTMRISYILTFSPFC